MTIRPEDLTRSQTTRMSVNQTLGGAWVDAWGEGVPTVNIAGHTGWGAGDLPDGFEQFKELHAQVFEKWHAMRAAAIQEGKDPDGIKLIFSDKLDDFVWCVAPQSFILKRNRARPLLSMYQIAMTKLSDAVLEEQKKTPDLQGREDLGLDSLDASLKVINDFSKDVRGAIASALGPIKAGIDGLVKLTASALSAVRSIVSAGMNAVRSVAGPVLEIGQGLTKVASNVFRIVSDTAGLPMRVRNTFMQVGGAFTNAFCLLRNVFKSRGFLPQYMGLYGASYCSSTAGGSPVSKYIGANVFPKIFPAAASAVTMTAAAETALGSLANMDPLKPAGLPVIGGLLNTIHTGVSIATSVVDKAISQARSMAGSHAAASDQEEGIAYV